MNNYEIRKLEKSDYYKGYFYLLNQLTNSPCITYDNFCKQFDLVNSRIYVIEDNNQIIASGTLLIERKFIHNISLVGHIEDIIVSNQYRGKKVGKQIINYLINIAKKENCYKIILNCKENIKEFYEKNGFKNNGLQMTIYF